MGHVKAAVSGALEGGGDGVLFEFRAEVFEAVGGFFAVWEFDGEAVAVWVRDIGHPEVVADVELFGGRHVRSEVLFWSFGVAWLWGVDYEGRISHWV